MSACLGRSQGANRKKCLAKPADQEIVPTEVDCRSKGSRKRPADTTPHFFCERNRQILIRDRANRCLHHPYPHVSFMCARSLTPCLLGKTCADARKEKDRNDDGDTVRMRPTPMDCLYQSFDDEKLSLPRWREDYSGYRKRSTSKHGGLEFK